MKCLAPSSVAHRRSSGGGGRTRTYEGVSQRIYSPPPLPLGTLPRTSGAKLGDVWKTENYLPKPPIIPRPVFSMSGGRGVNRARAAVLRAWRAARR